MQYIKCECGSPCSTCCPLACILVGFYPLLHNPPDGGISEPDNMCLVQLAVCPGLPPADILLNGQWPTSCNWTTRVGVRCNANCSISGSASIMCGSTGWESTSLSGSCAAPQAGALSWMDGWMAQLSRKSCPGCLHMLHWAKFTQSPQVDLARTMIFPCRNVDMAVPNP